MTTADTNSNRCVNNKCECGSMGSPCDIDSSTPYCAKPDGSVRTKGGTEEKCQVLNDI